MNQAPHSLPVIETNYGARRDVARPVPYRNRAQSISPSKQRPRSSSLIKNPQGERRCQSLSPLNRTSKHATQPADNVVPEKSYSSELEKEVNIPQCLVSKLLRILATKKREFMKIRKSLISQQNSFLEQYASLKDIETRAGVKCDESIGDVRVVSVTGWPPHDLLLLIRDDLLLMLNCNIGASLGQNVIHQLQSQLQAIPDEVVSVCAEIMARRIDILDMMKTRRQDRNACLEWKAKNHEFDQDTEKIHSMVAGVAENLKAKINFSMEIAKVPWIDRETLIKKIEKLGKDNLALQTKIDENAKKDKTEDTKPSLNTNEALEQELNKERAAREALKDVVSSAESMLRVARARIANLERQLKESKAEAESARRKIKETEQLHRHRETSYDARSKKLLEVSKTGEVTIEALSRQRDALELRVKELHEHIEKSEKLAQERETDLIAKGDSLQAKLNEQEKSKAAAEIKVSQLESRIKDLEGILQNMRERSTRLVEVERRRKLDYVPSKESEPSDRETEVWKELQVTRVALVRAEEELRQSRADKDGLLFSLSRIAQQEGNESIHDKMATELLEREHKIGKLQRLIEESKENENLMEQTMTQYENQIATLKHEVKRLRNYDCYSKEIPYHDLQTELLELHMQVEKLQREKSALVNAAASRSLMLERHEKAAELFAKATRARQGLAALLDGGTDAIRNEDIDYAEISRSLSSVCTSSAETWSALRAERSRVLRLESALLAQGVQLEREGRVRTQLERRRAILEREIIKQLSPTTSEAPIMNNAPSLLQDVLWYNK